MRKSHQLHGLLGICFVLLFFALGGGSEQVWISGNVQASSDPEIRIKSLEERLENGAVANCRYGVAVSSGEHVPRIGAGWFLDFNPPDKYPAATNGAEWVEMLKVFQAKTAEGYYLPSYRTAVPLNEKLIDHLQAHPGSLWLIGNEVERIGQGEMYPEVYARAYHEIRKFIKKHDPTARIALSGLVQVTPNRLQYLDLVWDAYNQLYGGPMPVDVWNMHIYVLPEVEPDGITPNGIANIALGTDPTLGKRGSGGDPNSCPDLDVYCFAEHDDLTIFTEQIVAMRQWMKDHGQQQKPLILSEFSQLYPYTLDEDTCFVQDEFGKCFTPNRVSNFMSNAFSTLNNLQDPGLGFELDENRLVQQWLWFSMYLQGVGTVSNILEDDEQTLTQVGQDFRQIVFNEPLVLNLFAEKISKVVVAADSVG